MDFIARILIAILDWIAHLNGRQASRPASSLKELAAAYRGPRPGQGALHSTFGGRAWRYDAQGVHADGTLLRTPGEPATCRTILGRYGAIILEMAERHGVNPALVVMTIAVETGAYRSAGFTGPRTFRWESHVLNRDEEPPFRGTYSAGPMQILATTARELIRTKGSEYGLGMDAAVAPAVGKRPLPPPKTHPLYDAEINIALGTAVIRRQSALTGDDPILVAAAYNSGGLYRSRANAWRLRSHGDHLDRAARWYGDACAVLREIGI